MKKFFIGVVLSVLFVAQSAFALPFGEESPEILADMYKNPAHYVCIGTDNFGLSYYLDKTTINVHEYAPPNYIIAFKTMYHLLASDGRNVSEHAGYSRNPIIRYKYDYSSRKMYVEKFDSAGNSYWKYVDVSPLSKEQQRKMNGGDFRSRAREISSGEIAFYLAYNMSFFDEPVMAKDFIENGLSRMIPLQKLNLSDTRNGDTQTTHEYNHRTNQIEVWQHTYNKNTKSFDSKRIK